MRSVVAAFAVAVAVAFFALPLLAQSTRELPPGLIVPDAAKPGPGFDVDRATEAYLNVLTPAQRAKSDAYFEGGYWLQLWELVYGFGVAALLLLTGWSRRMRERAQRITTKPWAYTMLYVVQWLVAGSLLQLPWLIYTGYVREHQYELSNLTFGGWFAEMIKGFVVMLVFIPPLVAMMYWAVRRAGARWWVWASGIMLAASIFAGIVAPVVVAPLFNKYTPLPPGPVRDAVLSLARANRVPATDVYVVDQSRQTKRVSANVSGMGATTRISLNDNLLERTSLPEIRAVMAHEMGHYVLHHTTKLVIYTMLAISFVFFLVHVTFDAAMRRWGARLGIEGRGDPAGLPLVIAIFSMYMLLVTPVTNGIVRQAESEADAFAINASREPHGFASVAMRLSTYRKLHPGPVEEMLFYDHPSGYDRVHRAMTWLKENQTESR